MAKEKTKKTAKRVRRAAYSDTLDLMVSESDCYKDSKGKRFTSLELIRPSIRLQGIEIYMRFASNVERGKYDVRTLFGTRMICVDAPMKDDNCSVVLDFVVTK